MIKKIILIIIAVITIIGLIFLRLWKAFGQRPLTSDKQRYSKLMSSYYQGSFHNDAKIPQVNNAKKETIIKKGRIPRDKIPIKHLRNIPDATKDELKWVWLGHSSSLLQMQGLNILIDPVFSKYASPIAGFGPKRFARLPIEIEDLPKIDIVVISHDHYDHLDYATIIKIDDKVKAYCVPLGVEKHLIRWGIETSKIHTMAWWDIVDLKGLKITAVPANHFSGRLPWLNNTTLWCGYVFENEYYKVYYTGDSGYSDYFKEISKRFGEIDFMILEDGQYDKKWKKIHMTPDQALQAVKDIKAKWIVPVHWGTFSISFHAWDDPVNQITSLASKQQIKVATPLIGEIVDYAQIEKYQDKWWQLIN